MTGPVAVTRDGDVTVLRMTTEEGRFNPAMISAINTALDEVEASSSPAAVVLTGDGKFFSNGLDLEWMSSAPDKDADGLLHSVHELFARVLVFPTPTVAAVNGHAFAAGAMLAMAFDSRVMREDRGFFCVPEADLGLPFTPEMTALLRATLPVTTAREAMFTGRRYGARDAVAAGIVDAAVAQDELLASSVARAAAQADKPRSTLREIKRAFFSEALAVLPPI